MAGLLRHIRKSKQDLGSKITDVVSTDDAVFGEPKERADVDALLQGLLKESAQSGQEIPRTAASQPGEDGRKPRGSRVVRRHMPDTNVRRTVFTEEVKPWWLEGQHSSPPQIDAFIASVVPLILPALGKEEWLEGSIAKSLRELCDKAVTDGVLDHRLPRRLQEQAERELAHILTGKGPLQPLFEDALVTDVFVANHRSVRVLRNGSMLDTPFTFRSPAEYRLFLGALLGPDYRMGSDHGQITEAQLSDRWRTRLHLVDGRYAETGEPQLHLKIPRLQQAAFFDLLQTKTLPPTLAAWLGGGRRRPGGEHSRCRPTRLRQDGHDVRSPRLRKLGRADRHRRALCGGLSSDFAA